MYSAFGLQALQQLYPDTGYNVFLKDEVWNRPHLGIKKRYNRQMIAIAVNYYTRDRLCLVPVFD